MTTAAKEHAAHHVQQGICLSGNLNAKVQFPNLSQSVVPNGHVPNLCHILTVQLSEKIGSSSLDGQEQQAKIIKQGEGGVHPNVGAGAAHGLHTKGRVRCRQSRGENQQCLIGAAGVSDQEVWQDCARCVKACGVRFVMSVPFILKFRERFGRFGGSEDQMLLGIVCLVFCETLG